jgi:DNA replicative helicase MCM subunit Mcm2 (Cdc46/Mcm family)
MLESLIRMTEAHARLLMKSAATVFDAVSVIILMEHTLMTDLYKGEFLPSVLFENQEQYLTVRKDLLYKLGLDPNGFSLNEQADEMKKRQQTPSPIRRIEDSLYLNHMQSFDLSLQGPTLSEINSSF